MLEESAFVARGSDLAAGESETVSADLKPGSYELVCYLPATTRQVSGSRSRSSSDAGDARSGVARQCVA
jgi:hypothetical protein